VDHKAELKAKDLEIKKIKEVAPTVAVPIKRGRGCISSNDSIAFDDEALALKVSKLVVQGIQKKVATVIEGSEEASATELSKLYEEKIKLAVTAKELELTKAYNLVSTSSAVSEAKFNLSETYHTDQKKREDDIRQETRADTNSYIDKFYEITKLLASQISK